MRKFLLASLLVFLAQFAGATAYTVKSSGGNFTTISACAATAVAGDTCMVFASASPQAGWTQAASGSAGNPITFKANAGDAVLINSTISLNSRSYITFGGAAVNEGFEVTAGMTFTTMSHVIIQNVHIHNTSGRCFANNSNVAATFNTWLNNIVEFCGGAGPGQAQGWILGGNNNLIDGNIIRHVEDGLALYCDRCVIRNNHFGPLTHAEIGTQHPDTVESAGTSGDIPLTHLLYEGNIIQDWGPDDANSHVQNLSDLSSLGITNDIWRFNAVENIGSYSFDFDRNDNFQYVYNNSIAYGLQSNHDNVDIGMLESGGVGAPNGKDINNLTTNTVNAGGWAPVGVSPSSQTGFVENHNAIFNSGYSSCGTRSSWKGPHYTGDSTNNFDASDIFNCDPKFVNAGPTNADLHLQAGSPMIGAGGSLTKAVGAGSSSTALTVADAGFFQDGYSGIVQADWIRIGAFTIVQISAINYSTNVITLGSAATWANNDPIYLYKKSDGIVVLNGANPDVGAYPFSSGTCPN